MRVESQDRWHHAWAAPPLHAARRHAAHVAVILLILAGCAPRHVDPVQMSNPGDAALSCPQIDQEIEADKNQVAILAKADTQLENNNIAAGAASAVVGIPALFAMDLTREEQIRLRSTLDRIERLEFLKGQKQCP